VKALALHHIAELEAKITLLDEMRGTLADLADACDGNHRPDCPIIGSLEGTIPMDHAHHHHKH
jgi:MerR family copper efflux transcriptional regulator